MLRFQLNTDASVGVHGAPEEVLPGSSASLHCAGSSVSHEGWGPLGSRIALRPSVHVSTSTEGRDRAMTSESCLALGKGPSWFELQDPVFSSCVCKLRAREGHT